MNSRLTFDIVKCSAVLLVVLLLGVVFVRPNNVAAEIRTNFNYAILISDLAASDSAWLDVANALAGKYPGTKIFTYSSLDDLVDPVKRFSPDYIAFVCRPEEASPTFVKQASRFNRELENRPYGTAVWGIVTGYNSDDAMRIARCSAPLSINFGLGGMQRFIDALPRGIAYCEFYNERNKWQEKKAGQNLQERSDAPNDHLVPMINLINSNKVDGIWTSGHGTRDSWQTYYADEPVDPDMSGEIVAVDGELFGVNKSDKNYPINSNNPKIYLGVGNCLTASIEDINKAYSLAWIHSGGVNQYFGYTVETYYGLMGWGMADNFFYRGAMFNVPESMFAANQSLLLALDKKIYPDETRDLEYDRDVCVVYGDPAWMAKVPFSTAKTAEQWNCQLEKQVTGDRILWELTVKFKKDCEFSPSGGKDFRPVFVFLPQRVKDPVATGSLSDVTAYHIASNFVVVNFSGLVSAGETRKFGFSSAVDR